MGDDVPIHYVVSPVRRALVALHATATAPLGCLLVGFSAFHYLRYHRHGYGPDSVASPWSLYIIGAVGVVMVCAAVSSFRQGLRLTGEKAGQLSSLSRTARSFIVSLSSQVVLVSLYALVVSEKWDMSADPSGTMVVVGTFIDANFLLVASFTAALFTVQSVAIIASIWERSLVRRAMEEEEAAEAADLEEVARQAYEPVSASAWNERLREKYGVDPLNEGDADDEDLGRPLLDDASNV